MVRKESISFDYFLSTSVRRVFGRNNSVGSANASFGGNLSGIIASYGPEVARRQNGIRHVIKILVKKQCRQPVAVALYNVEFEI